MSQRPAVFSPVVLGLFAAAVTAIFALSLILGARTRSDEPVLAGTGSRSAIGHAGLFELLKRLDLPLERNRIGGRHMPGTGGVLLYIEPDPALVEGDDGLDLESAGEVLLVLPKWQGLRDVDKPGFLRQVERRSIASVHRVVELVASRATLARTTVPTSWTVNPLGLAPRIADQVQLLRGPGLEPVLGDADGMLIAKVKDTAPRIWILADPDPLENHGIVKPENARFALALLGAMRHGDGAIVFDETTHGIKTPARNPFELLFTFPYAAVTLQILVAVGLLLLATTARFGGAEREPPPFDLGKRRLIANMAALLDRAGHQAVVLRRYLEVMLREAGAALHAPAGLDDGALAAWLDRIGKARGVTLSSVDILARGSATQARRSRELGTLIAAARDMHRFTGDLVDGPGPRQDRR